MKKLITKGIILLTLSGFIGFVQTSSPAIISQTDISAAEAALLDERKYSEALNIRKRLPVLGFDNIHANANFISFLLYFGDDKLRNEIGHGLSHKFFESIIDKDPYYTDFYVFLTNSVSFKAAQPDKAAKLMASGLKALEENRLDDSFYVWRYKGVDELLFLNDVKSAENSFRMAANWAEESNHPDSELISYISQQTADFIAQNPDSKAAQIGAWSSVLSTAVDDDTRNRAVEAIAALGGEVVVDEDGRTSVRYSQEEQTTES